MSIKDILNIKLLELDDYHLTVFSLVVVFAIILVSYLGLKLIKRSLHKKKGRSASEVGRRHSIYLIIRYVVWVVVLLACVESLGIDLTILLAGSAALLVGLGLGIQQIFNDIVSGMFLLFEGSISVGDILEVDGIVCKVEEINLRSSMVKTRDDIMVIVPNHKFINENVTNWSHQNELTRFSVELGVSYSSDPDKVREVLLKILENNEAVLHSDTRKPSVLFTNFGESSLDFRMMFYSRETFRIERTMSELRFDVFRRFKEADIEIPFPQRDLHIKTSNVEPKIWLEQSKDTKS